MADRSMNGDAVEGKSKHGQCERPDADKVAQETGFRNSIMCWNVNSVKDPNVISNYIEQYKVSIVGIVDTRLHPEDLKEVCDEIKKDWVWEWNKFTIIDEGGIRILVGWDPKSVTVTVRNAHEQALHLFIKTCDGTEDCYCSIIYAKDEHEDRQSLWSNMYQRRFKVGYDPWFIMGDFHATRSHADTNAERYNINGTSTTDFNQIVSALNMDDVPCTCPGEKRFTWSKRRYQNGRLKKTDWVMANEEFLIKYPHSSAHFLDFTHYSDHKPAILVFDKRFVDIENLGALRYEFVEELRLHKGQMAMEALERLRIMVELEIEERSIHSSTNNVVEKTPETAAAIQKPFENEVVNAPLQSGKVETSGGSRPKSVKSNKYEETESDDMPLKQSSEDDVGNRDGETDSDEKLVDDEKTDLSVVKSSLKNKDGKKQGCGKNVENKDQTKSLSADDGGMNVSEVGAGRNVDVNGLSTATKRIRSATKAKVKKLRSMLKLTRFRKLVLETKVDVVAI